MYREIMICDAARMMHSKTAMSDQDLVRNIAINSKMTKPGDLFFALQGHFTDGHKFVEEAYDMGAIACVVERHSGNVPEIFVDDTLFALGSLAQKYRNMFDPVTIAITGTNGKTTVKNITAAILSRDHRVLYSKKNYNSLIGLPLTIFELSGMDDYLVVEMGTSSPGEISRLCEIAKPRIGVITTIGPGHLAGLGSIKGVKKEKLSLVQSLPDNGFALVGEGCDDIKKKNVGHFNENMLTDIKIMEYGSHFIFDQCMFFTPLLGMSNVMNCLAALQLCTKLGIDRGVQKSVLKTIRPETGRMEPIHHQGLLIIDDTYNANPASMKAAIDFIAMIKRSKILILGDMLELGKESDRLHNEVGIYARQHCDMLFSFGKKSKLYKGRHFNDKEKLVNELVKRLEGDEVILIKASRGLRFETIVAGLLRKY